MKTLFAALAVTALLGTGCVVVRPPHGARSSAAASEKKCPPGHQWSDGRCHSTGKGHDPDKKKSR